MPGPDSPSDPLSKPSSVPAGRPSVHLTGVLPVYYWHGARPFPLDLDEAESGAAVWLMLQREGDLRFVILGRDLALFTGVGQHRLTPPDTPDWALLELTLADLERDGWQVCGRLDMRFTGHDAGDPTGHPIQGM